MIAGSVILQNLKIIAIRIRLPGEQRPVLIRKLLASCDVLA